MKTDMGLDDPEGAVLSDPLEVTPQWLSEALQESGRLGGPRVTAVQIVEDRIWSSRVVRLAAKVDGRPDLHLVLKLCPPGGRMHGHEVVFYQQIAPRSPAGCLVPCLNMGFSELTQSFHLLMEDLSSSHTQAISSVEEIPDDECQFAFIKVLARLQVHWWASTDLIRVPGIWPERERLQRFCNSTRNLLEQYREQVQKRLRPGTWDLFEKISEWWPSALAGRLKNQEHFTLIHGDAHAGNVLLPRRNSDAEGARLLDWPNWGIGLPTDDVVYFLLGFPVEQRKTAEPRMLKEHWRALQVGVPGSYTEEHYWKDYRLSAARTFLLSMRYQGAATPPPWAGRILDRSVDILRDLGLGECR